jgi:glycosyltransferase involved in cell wall biosynthesis
MTRPVVSIIIKALNEERHIAACIEAALREAASVGGEVVLVDSLSTDRTVEIASRYPIRIVQFANIEDRGCGAAVQLGYQHAEGEFIYVLDGDMILKPDFLGLALAVLRADTALAGVGGRLADTSVLTASDHKRAQTASRLRAPLDVEELGGGGLYRQAAIEAVGYLAHRWLPAFEEAELGMRLRAAGWRLRRLPDTAVTHNGHAESDLGMMRRLWRNRRAHAGGMLLRAALGTAWWKAACRKQWHVLLTFVLHGLALATGLLFAAPFSLSPVMLICGTETLLWGGMLCLLSARKRSVYRGALAVLLWHYFAAAALIGFFRRLPDPRTPIVSITAS